MSHSKLTAALHNLRTELKDGSKANTLPCQTLATTHLLGGSCIGNCFARRVEGDEKCISFCGNFIAIKLGQMHAHDSVMEADGVHHCLVVPLPHLCAALHVCADERNAGLSCTQQADQSLCK